MHCSCVIERKKNIRKYCLQANVPADEVAGEWSGHKNQVHLATGHCGVGRLPV